MADPQTNNFVVDKAGNMTAAGTPGMVDVTGGGGTSLGSLAPHPADPYTKFNLALADMLHTATNQSTENAKLLGGANDALTTTSVNPAGPKPFDPTIFSGQQVAGQETLQKGFQPLITSIKTQQEATAAATAGIKDTITGLETAYQPVVLQPGQSLVSRDGTVLKSGHSYTAQVNPLTGLLDGFDQNTGSWASQDSSGEQKAPAPKSNSDLVGGVDFSGKSTGVGVYATDPNYAVNVDSLYNQIKQAVPIPTPAGIDQFITAHAGGKGNVTGQMIITASSQYGIDPNLLTAVLGQESDFGTAGAGSKTMNPGNVGNTGTATQNFNSWQAGVNAAAYEIARRMPGNDNAQKPTTPASTSPVGGTFSETAGTKVGQLPTYMQSYVDAGPKGVAYINDDRVPASSKVAVQTMASRAGIPYVEAADASAIKSIQSVYGAIQQMKTLAQNNLNSGVSGRAINVIGGAAARALQTDWGGNLEMFDSYRDVAVKAVQALAGGAGSGLRINGAEIMANVQALPTSGDNLETSMKKINTITNLIDNQLATTFPYITKDVAPVGNAGATAKEGQTKDYQGLTYKVVNGVWTPQ